MKKVLMLLIFASLFLISCTEQGQLKYIDGDDIIPPSPPFWEYFTVRGYDQDEDGVRDDVELWINSTYEDSNIRKAMKHYARLYNRYMFLRDMNQVVKMVELLERSHACVNFVSSYKYKGRNSPSSVLYDYVFNNYWRRKMDEEAGKYLPSGIYSSFNGNRLEQYRQCIFKVERLNFLLKSYYKDGTYKNNATDEERVEYIKLMEKLK